MEKPSQFAWRAAALYAAGAVLWIFVTDTLLESWTSDNVRAFSQFQKIKGALFVAVTTTLLFAILWRWLLRLRRAELALHEQEERWRLAFESVGDGMWETHLRSGMSYYSPKWKGILGYADDEIGPTLEEWQSRIHPDDRSRVEAQLLRCRGLPSASFRSEFRMCGKDGNYRWVLGRGRMVGEDRLLGAFTDIDARKRAEAELIDAAERYRRLFESNPSPMWIYDTATFAIIAVNDSAVAKYGYSREQFAAMTILDLRPTSEVPDLMENLRTRTAAAQISGPWRHRLADGSIIVVDVTSHQIDWNGRAARVVLMHDITEQTATRRAVEASEQKFSAIFRDANDAILIADQDTVITDCNPRALELFRAARADMIGRRVPEFFPEKQPDGTSSLKRALAVFRTLHRGASGPIEWTNRRPDGTCFVSEITISPLRSQERDAMVIVVRDLTERQKTSRQLELLHAALRATPTGWLITDHKGNIEWVNPAFTRLTGYEFEEAVGKNPRMLRSDHQSAEFYADMWSTILRGDVWEGELRNRRKNGTYYDERMLIAPVRDASGAIAHYVATKQDVTAERQLEQQLGRAQRLESIGLLASGIAHDLNNVLTPILLCVEFLKVDFPTPKAAAKLDLIGQAAQRGAGIVRQVLTFARGVEGERSMLQPSVVVNEVGQLARETLPRNIAVQIEGAGPDGWFVQGDLTQLHQALLNLVVNARDAMPEGGVLTLRRRDLTLDDARARRNALAPGRYVELSVTDTGGGISDEILERIFDPFFSTKERGKGTGLGLATVFGILRGHGGAIEVQTQWAQGTTFSLLLPALEKCVGSDAVPPAPEGKLDGHGRRVLVVEDEAPIRALIALILRSRGFEVVEAEDGIDGLARYRDGNGAWSAAIIDMMMPRLDGMALTRELRAVEPDLPIVGMSGMMGEGETDETSLRRFDPHAFQGALAKPFGEPELLAALHRALESRPSR